MAPSLLLMSSSRVNDSEYLQAYAEFIKGHFDAAQEVLFIPYAGVTMDYDTYTARVQQALAAYDIRIKGLHTANDPQAEIRSAEGILVGGGNTFRLLQQLYHYDLLAEIQAKVKQGCPYAGWSAGANIAGLTIRTTNDMPIVEPPSFRALELVPLQLNPHYVDVHPPGFHGETRAQRLAEYMTLHPGTPVLALREGALLEVSASAQVIHCCAGVDGSDPAFLFRAGTQTPLPAGTDLNKLV